MWFNYEYVKLFTNTLWREENQFEAKTEDLEINPPQKYSGWEGDGLLLKLGKYKITPIIWGRRARFANCLSEFAP